MTTYYSVSKCNYFSFVKDTSCINEDLVIGKCYDFTSIDDLKNIVDDEFTLVIDTNSDYFNDIEIQIDKDKEGMNSTLNKTQDVLGKSDHSGVLGASNTIEALTTKKFVIVPGRNNGCCQSYHIKQNHDVIDIIAKNGVLVSPKASVELSIGGIINELSSDRHKKFNLILVNKYLIQDVFDGKYPSEYNKPSYVIGKGEITAVWFRYICLNFFGYQSVIDDTNVERMYDI